ncbi:MAG: hypothetical protein ACYTFW_05250 [Planctomycetota bacterium]|jgi:hypothetical protein
MTDHCQGIVGSYFAQRSSIENPEQAWYGVFWGEYAASAKKIVFFGFFY